MVEFREDLAKVFAPYFERDDTLFSISTDFHHWGDKFNYTRYVKYNIY